MSTVSLSHEEALHLFVRNNWLGPYEELPEALKVYQEAHKDQILASLVVNGEYPYRLVVDPVALCIALKSEKPWIRLRALFLHQRILDEPAPTLKDELFQIIEVSLTEASSMYGPSVYTETALIFQYYNGEKRAEEMLALAAEKIGFTFSLTGALGKRSQHQTFETTQLTVESSLNTSMPAEPSAVPKDLPLNDDVLLERPMLTDGTPLGQLGHEALAILLAQSQQLTTFHAMDTAVTEKALAFVLRVLEKPSVWSIYSTGLFLRSKLECSRSRTVERASLQIQALVDQIKASEPSFEERLPFFFATALPSPWEMDATQGYLFASLGAFKTALEIFNRRELWDEAISCLLQLGDIQGAEERIAEEMKRMPENPKLWCLLGDTRGEDLECYQRAWELSGKRFSRAQRSIGKIHFKKEKWASAVESFELALAINPLFSRTWFLLGCAAVQLSDSKRALNAFSRVVSLEPDNPEAWNNIASIHLSEDRTKDALGALKEASRLDYANAKIHENYFEVALGCGELYVAVQALRRVAELQEAGFQLSKYQRLVSLLAKAVQFVGTKEPEMQAVRKQCISLVDQVLSKHFASNPELWHTQARLHGIVGEIDAQKKELFKAYRSAKALPYASDAAAFGKLVAVLVDLAELIREGKNEDELFQLDMMLSGVKKAAASFPADMEAVQELNKL